MASIEKRGDGWRVRWRGLDGKPKSRQCPDRATARTLKADVERTLALGREWVEQAAPAPRSLEDLAVDFLLDCGRRLSQQTCRHKRGVLGDLLDFAGPDAPATALARSTLERWHAALIARTSRRTAAAYLADACQLWRWAYERDEWADIVGRPARIDPGPVPPSVPIPPTPLDAIDRAIAAADTVKRMRYFRVMLVMRFTGLRAGQVLRLEWRDFDLEAMRLVVRPELGKSRAEKAGRTIPLHPDLVRAMAGWGRREGRIIPAGTKLSGEPLARIWADAEHDPRQPLHGIRHAIATVLRMQGVPEDVVGRLLGHSLTVTGTHYVDAAAMWPALVEAVGRIPPLGGSVVVGLRALR